MYRIAVLKLTIYYTTNNNALIFRHLFDQTAGITPPWSGHWTGSFQNLAWVELMAPVRRTNLFTRRLLIICASRVARPKA